MRRDLELEATIVAKYGAVAPVPDERSRLRWAAAESLAIGYGGDALVSSATGLARETVRKGRREVARRDEPSDRIRAPDAGPPGVEQEQPGAQFEHINGRADEMLAAGQPVISVDTKKKELVGNFANAGRESQPKGTPPAVSVHDFPSDAEGRAIPYGVYDMARNEAWVSVGRDHDTPAFAAASIRHWCERLGRGAYPDATDLYVTADAGGSNGYRSRVWKRQLQRFADEIRLTVHASHFPLRTSKWNKIEHRLFCHITANWRGTPLTTCETLVDRIGSTRTAAGLRVQAELADGEYPTGVNVPQPEMGAIEPVSAYLYRDGNYKLIPR